jgi:two-component system nitrate/nitrite response regulator NarL
MLLLCSKREGVRKRWLEGLESNFIAYQASTVDEILSHLSSFQVDVVLLHRSLVGTAQLKVVCENSTESKVIMFSDRPNDQEGIVCLRHGCLGYGNTYISHSKLVAAVQTVESGLAWLNSSLMAALISGLGPLSREKAENLKLPAEDNEKGLLQTLSNREYQVAQLVAEGFKNSEIAAEIGVTERTVKAHLSSIYAKTKTKGRLNLALLMKKVNV